VFEHIAVDVVRDDAITRSREAARHRVAHLAETDETDARRGDDRT
jgi:hypothetical protein